MSVSAGRVVLQFGVDADALPGELRTIQQQIRGLGTGLQSFARGFAPISAGFAAVGLAGVTMATDLNKAMGNVASLIPGATARVAELKTGIQDLAPVIGVTTADLADGAYQVISAFGDTNDTLAILETNARAAAAGVATTTDAINLTSAVTKGYGDTSAAAVAKASDLALLTVRLGQTTFPELAASIGRVTPLTAELGVKQEELFGVMATATGVTGSAAEVSTQLRGVMQGLMQPTESMAGLFTSLGVESGKALLEQRGLQGAIDAIVGAASAAGVPLGKFLGSIEGQTLALALAGSQSDTFTQKLAEMQGAAGATDAAFQAQTQGVNAAGFGWSQLQSTLAVMAQQIGDVIIPVLLNAADGLKPFLAVIVDLVHWVGTLPQPVQTVIVGLGGLVAAAAPVAYVLGGLITAVSSIVGLFAAGSTGAAVLGGALTVLTGPIGLIAAAVVGLGAIWLTWGDDITRVVSETYASVKEWLWDKLEPVLTPIIGLLDSIGKMFETFGKLVGAVAGKIIEVHVQLVGAITMWLVDRLQPIFRPLGLVVEAFGAVFSRVKDAVVLVAQRLYEGVKTWMLDRFTAVVDGIKAKVDAVTGFFENMYQAVVGGSFVPDMLLGIKAEFSKLPAVMVTPAESATGAAAGAFSNMFTGVTREMSTAFSGWLKQAGDFGGALGGVFSGIASGIDGIVGGLLKSVSAKFQTMIDKAMSTSSTLGNAFSQFTAPGTAQIAQAWFAAAIGPHYNDAGASAAMEAQQFADGAAYQGMTIAESLAAGNGAGLSQDAIALLESGAYGLKTGGEVFAGQGMPAVLHDHEAVFPLPAGFDLASALGNLEHSGTGGALSQAIEAMARRFDRTMVELRTMLPMQLKHALGAR